MLRFILIGFFCFLLGVIGTLFYNKYINSKNIIEISGIFIRNLESQENKYFMGRSYIDKPKIKTRVYLGSSEVSLNLKKHTGDKILITGYLHVIDVGNKQMVTEIKAINIK